MENQDKIYEQFKSAAEKAETKDFPGMEKVWSRVDAKLDTKVLKKQNNNWQKFGVAASAVIVATIIYLFTKSEKEIVTPQNSVVIIDTAKIISPKPIVNDNAIVSTETKESIIKPNAEEILQNQITKVQTVVISEEPTPLAEKVVITPSNNNTNYILKGRVFEAMGVSSSPQDAEDNKKAKSEVQETKNPPLLVVDGKAITNNRKSAEKVLSEIDNDNVETIYLKEPLYIINGVHYSEESLFGKNPTSPYAPLDQQQITKTEILQGQDAVAKYGKKGEKGVVIITTKTGKPAVPK